MRIKKNKKPCQKVFFYFFNPFEKIESYFLAFSLGGVFTKRASALGQRQKTLMSECLSASRLIDRHYASVVRFDTIRGVYWGMGTALLGDDWAYRSPMRCAPHLPVGEYKGGHSPLYDHQSFF